VLARGDQQQQRGRGGAEQCTGQALRGGDRALVQARLHRDQGRDHEPSAAASQNTDAGPVTLNLSLNTLRSVDEVPFAAAIAAGTKLIMVSWAVYPALGAQPAGLSPNVVQGELRGRLDFTGVTSTDALEAGALQPFGSTQHRALRAALAGMDLLLCAAQDVTQGEQASAELAADYTDGTLDGPTFLAAVNRVITLRQSLA